MYRFIYNVTQTIESGSEFGYDIQYFLFLHTNYFEDLLLLSQTRGTFHGELLFTFIDIVKVKKLIIFLAFAMKHQVPDLKKKNLRIIVAHDPTTTEVKFFLRIEGRQNVL
jgi:hypothetical protein